MNDQLPLSLGKTALSRLKKLYEVFFTAEFGIKPSVYLYGTHGAVFKSLVKEFGEVGAGVRVMLHFRDVGDPAEYGRRMRAAFPIGWIRGNNNRYTVWLAENAKRISSVEDMLMREYQAAVEKSKLLD